METRLILSSGTAPCAISTGHGLRGVSHQGSLSPDRCAERKLTFRELEVFRAVARGNSAGMCWFPAARLVVDLRLMLPEKSAVPNGALRHLLLAAALVFTQQAAQLHALSHVQHDMAKAERSGKCVPPFSHPAEQCIAFHAVDSALPVLALALEPPKIALPVIASVDLPLPFAPRIEFDSRAPPVLS